MPFSLELTLQKAEMWLRINASRVLKRVHSGDLRQVEKLIAHYWFPKPGDAIDAQLKVQALEDQIPGLKFQVDFAGMADAAKCPFVYENPNSPHLQRLRQEFGFEALVQGCRDEYSAMLALGTWLGSRWDHGKDPLSGSRGVFDLVEVIRDGMRGKKFWCEIAATVAVQAFTSMGWPARLVTSSRNGYTWEHAVVEVWSNQFDKWFVMDTDFNVVYESRGIPLSAYELCHDGMALKSSGIFDTRLLGQAKPSLPITDLMPFYAYVHIDLRSDWYTRHLPWGSPAGGDLSTWWTARPDFPKLQSPKVRVEDRRQFNWPVNTAWLIPESVIANGQSIALRLNPVIYSPYFEFLQISVNHGPWRNVPVNLAIEIELNPGENCVQARVGLITQQLGPECILRIHRVHTESLGNPSSTLKSTMT